MASELVPYEDDGLTERQRAFCYAYCGEARFNATKAAIIAGYSPRSAVELASRELRNVHVRARIKALLAAHRLTQEAILAELAAVAMAPMEKFQQIVKEYKSKDGHITYQTVRQDLTPKVKALELAGKAEGMFSEKIDITIAHTRTIVGMSIEEVTGRTIDSTATDTTEENREQDKE